MQRKAWTLSLYMGHVSILIMDMYKYLNQGAHNNVVLMDFQSAFNK